jgi:hypothetical protein
MQYSASGESVSLTLVKRRTSLAQSVSRNAIPLTFGLFAGPGLAVIETSIDLQQRFGEYSPRPMETKMAGWQDVYAMATPCLGDSY